MACPPPRHALRATGPLASDAELLLVRCHRDGLGAWPADFLAATEKIPPALGDSREEDALQVDAVHPVGADLWAGGTRRLVLGEVEAGAVQPVDDRIGIFEDWLD